MAELVSLTANYTVLSNDFAALKQQLEWFKRQLFGEKSEKRLDLDPAVQGNLLAQLRGFALDFAESKILLPYESVPGLWITIENRL